MGLPAGLRVQVCGFLSCTAPPWAIAMHVREILTTDRKHSSREKI
jgi:hypothetical protein